MKVSMNYIIFSCFLKQENMAKNMTYLSRKSKKYIAINFQAIQKNKWSYIF